MCGYNTILSAFE